MNTQYTYDAGGAIASMPDAISLTLSVAPLPFEGVADNGLGAYGHTAGEFLAESQQELARLLVNGFSALNPWEHPNCLAGRIEDTLRSIQLYASLPANTLVS
jgi:hypothetical protein